MSTERSVEEIADRILDEIAQTIEVDEDGAAVTTNRDTHRIIAAALRAERERKVPPGHILDDQGVVRKMLGTLPVTADGVVVGNHTTLWINDIGEVTSLRVDNIGCSERDGCDEAFWEVGECYSTHAAAEAAAKEVSNG